MRSWRPLAAAAALLAYALGAYLLMVHAPAHPWSVAVLVGPLLGAAALDALRRRHRPMLAGCAAATLALALLVAHGGVPDLQRLYVLQHAGVHLALAGTFAATLRPGRTPLVTRLAQRVHLHFTAAMAAYTRRLTAAWVVYFVAMVGVSVTLYACAPWRWWSLFGNLLTPLAAAAFFVVEYGWRCRRHPEFERASLGAAWQAWRARPPSGAVR
ncbi:MAG: hypothetical protein AMXMBFR66_32550 [Pseudomonadota bacterium]|nr:hypothetical protein [Rubrivivax sp.]